MADGIPPEIIDAIRAAGDTLVSAAGTLSGAATSDPGGTAATAAALEERLQKRLDLLKDEEARLAAMADSETKRTEQAQNLIEQLGIMQSKQGELTLEQKKQLAIAQGILKETEKTNKAKEIGLGLTAKMGTALKGAAKAGYELGLSLGKVLDIGDNFKLSLESSVNFMGSLISKVMAATAAVVSLGAAFTVVFNMLAKMGKPGILKGLTAGMTTLRNALSHPGGVVAGMKRFAGFLAGGIRTGLAGAAAGMKAFVGGLLAAAPAAIAFTAALAGLAAVMAAFAGIGLMVKVIDAVVKLTISLMDAENAFRRTTGAAAVFAKDITQSYARLREYGVTVEDVSKAQTALYTNFKDFSMLQPELRAELLDDVAAFAKLGISVETSAKTLELATKTYGLAAEQGGQFLEQIRRDAEQLQIPIGDYSQALAASGDEFARLGTEGPAAFKELMRTSKMSGLELSKILALTNKFDTFEGAAEQTGMLNAALGGNFVNAMDMMMATNPAERFEMIRDAIMSTGQSFQEMDYYQRQFIAKAAGLNNVNELAFLMSDRMDLLSDSTDQSAESMITAQERALAYANVQDQLRAAFAELTPIVSGLDVKIKSFIGVLTSAESRAKIQKLGEELWNFSTKVLGAFGVELGKAGDMSTTFHSVLDGLIAFLPRFADFTAEMVEAGRLIAKVFLGVAWVFKKIYQAVDVLASIPTAVFTSLGGLIQYGLGDITGDQLNRATQEGIFDIAGKTGALIGDEEIMAKAKALQGGRVGANAEAQKRAVKLHTEFLKARAGTGENQRMQRMERLLVAQAKTQGFQGTVEVPLKVDGRELGRVAVRAVGNTITARQV